MPNSEIIYLGIDPGTSRVGYGLIKVINSKMLPLAWGVIESPGDDPAAQKIAVRENIVNLIKSWQPTIAGVERLFFFKNKKTVFAVSEMRGVILVTLAEYKLKIHEFTPLQVKQSICGHGRADKSQVQKMIQSILSIKEVIRPDDAADALALALCCSTVGKQY